MIKHFLNPPNWFTSASIFCSVYAIALVLGDPGPTPDPETLSRASVLVIFGGIFDLLDGRLARLTNRESEFGLQLDTLADTLGFGLAPALLAWVWVLHDLGPLGIAITFWYVLAACFRLARYNVVKKEGAWPLDGHSQGLTSTLAGGSLVTFVWVANGYGRDWLEVPAWAAGLLVATLGLLMISNIPYRNFKDLRRNKKARSMLAVFLASCLLGAVVLDPSMWWGVGAALYLSLGLVDGLVTAVWHRRLRNALMLDDLEEALATDEDYDDYEELEA